ncbi:HAMP domain-containing protein, partial [bacterium]|nr:HAMP domain-containing protein [bacterium]
MFIQRVMVKTVLSLALILLVGVFGTMHGWASNTGPGISPDEALQLLQEGNARYVTGNRSYPNLDAKRLATVASGQHPFATVISCSDSRVPPEHLFDRGLGDIFTIRVAGNVCDTDEIGSIEYGVDHLGTPLMVVLGHTGCGAVTAVVTEAEVHGSIPPLVDNIQPAVFAAQNIHPYLQGKALVPEAVKANVWQAIDDLFKHSPSTQERAKNGRVRVVGAIYHLEDGTVEWLGQHPKQDELLKYTSGPAAGHTDSHSASALGIDTTIQAHNITLIDHSLLGSAHTEHGGSALDLSALQQIDKSNVLFWLIGLSILLIAAILWLAQSQFLHDLKIGPELFGSHGILLVLVLAIGLGCWYYMDVIEQDAAFEVATLDLDMMVNEMAVLENNFLLHGLQDQAKGETYLEERNTIYSTFQTDLSDIRNMHLDASETDALGRFETTLKDYNTLFSDVTAKFHEIEQDKVKLDVLAREIETAVEETSHRHKSELQHLEESGTASMRDIRLQTALVNMLDKIEILALKIARDEVAFILDKNAQHVTSMEENMGTFYGAVGVAEKLVPLCAVDKAEETKDLAMLNDIRDAMDRYRQFISTIINDQLIIEQDLVKIEKDREILDSLASALAHRGELKSKAAHTHAQEITIALMALAAIIGTILTYSIVTGVTGALRKGVRFAEIMASGDFSQPINANRKDEIGIVIDSMNTMRGKLNHLVLEIQKTAEQLASSSEELSASSQGMANAASEQAANLEESSAAISELASSIDQNKESAINTDGVSSKAADDAEQGGSAVSET